MHSSGQRAVHSSPATPSPDRVTEMQNANIVKNFGASNCGQRHQMCLSQASIALWYFIGTAFRAHNNEKSILFGIAGFE